MEKLKDLQRPNTLANLLTNLVECHEDGTSRMAIDRMPYPLIETNLQFFASDHINDVRCDPVYREWLATMYAHFGKKFLALYNGPMWKIENRQDEEDRKNLITKYNPNKHLYSNKTAPAISVEASVPPQSSSGLMSRQHARSSVSLEANMPAPSASTEAALISPPRATSTFSSEASMQAPSAAAAATPMSPPRARSTFSSEASMQAPSTSAAATPMSPPRARSTFLPETSMQAPSASAAVASMSPPRARSTFSLEAGMPAPSSFTEPALMSTPQAKSMTSPIASLPAPSATAQASPTYPPQATSTLREHAEGAHRKLSLLWKVYDDEEVAACQLVGVDIHQREQELLDRHGLRSQASSKRVYRATKEAYVNVVGLSASQLRQDFKETSYTPGPAIQRPILEEAKTTNPTARWWIKADACDLQPGLRESMKHEWTGDVDMGDGKVQALHQKYMACLSLIGDLTLTTIPQLLQQLHEEVPEIEEGITNSEKKFEKKKTKPGTTEAKLLSERWDVQGWQDLKSKNDELSKCLQAAPEEGQFDDLLGLRGELMSYKKNIFMKRRTMATHLLIFMISDERRNKKPYAVPVQIMPVSTVKDKTIRHLQEQLKISMNEMGMTVVGFVTDGEWNSLRTLGTSRPTSLIQLIMQAKSQAHSMKRKTLEQIFHPKLEMDTPSPRLLSITFEKSHKAVPAEDIGDIGYDLHKGMSFQDALHAHHKRIYKYLPDPLPWVPGTSKESCLECMKSIMATCLLREKIRFYQAHGADFQTNLYVPEIVDGVEFHDREDHGHLLKRIVKCARCGMITDCDLRRYIEALMDENTGLTAKALRGTDRQSVPDCEQMFSRGVIEFFQKKGYQKDAQFARLLHNWHKSSDGRGLTEEERSEYNIDMLNYLLDDWMLFHRDHKDHSQVDVSRPIKGIRDLRRETVIGITTNICSQELRRRRTDLPPEHPRASNSDDVESFIAILHRMLGRVFDHKTFLASYRKIFTEFQKMISVDLPFFYYTGPQQRYTTDPLPDFNQPSGHPERLDRIRYRRVGNIGSSVAARSAMPRYGMRTKRDEWHRKKEPLPPVNVLKK